MNAVTSANAQEVQEDYAGPTVFRRCRANPVSVAAAPPGGQAPTPHDNRSDRRRRRIRGAYFLDSGRSPGLYHRCRNRRSDSRLDAGRGDRSRWGCQQLRPDDCDHYPFGADARPKPDTNPLNHRTLSPVPGGTGFPFPSLFLNA